LIFKGLSPFQGKTRHSIGKIFLGREIARVMSHQRSSWLDRSTREIEEITAQVIRNVNLKSEDVVADIGAGTGYFSFRLIPIFSEGEVLAVNIQQGCWKSSERKSKKPVPGMSY
jgi:ubiquinone/menaquinone biosynthesis C-methylase UbiE